MNIRTTCRRVWPLLPWLKGARIEVRDFETARRLKLQTLTLGKGEVFEIPV